MKVFKAKASNTSYPIYVTARTIGEAVEFLRNVKEQPYDHFNLIEISEHSEPGSHVFVVKGDIE